MIRVNLLGGERQVKKKAPAFDIARRLTLVCGLILATAVAGIGWWYWALAQASARVDAEIVAAQQEAARLQSLLAEVQQFEAQRAQLQQRVQLIEQLRSGQSLPVQLLDHISKSLPDMLWLTNMTQEGGALTLQGRSTTLIALSDFVGNLGDGPLLQKPIEIVDGQVEAARTAAAGQPGIELINFTVKAALASASRGAGAAGPAPAAAAR